MIKYLVVTQPKKDKQKLWPDSKLYSESEAILQLEHRKRVWG